MSLSGGDWTGVKVQLSSTRLWSLSMASLLYLWEKYHTDLVHSKHFYLHLFQVSFHTDPMMIMMTLSLTKFPAKRITEFVFTQHFYIVQYTPCTYNKIYTLYVQQNIHPVHTTKSYGQGSYFVLKQHSTTSHLHIACQFCLSTYPHRCCIFKNLSYSVH